MDVKSFSNIIPKASVGIVTRALSTVPTPQLAHNPFSVQQIVKPLTTRECIT